MVEKQLLDTDIVIDLLRKAKPVTARARAYRRTHKRYTISVMTVLEVVKGYRKVGRDDRITTFVASLTRTEVLPFDTVCAEMAGRIVADLDRAGLPIGRIDPLIAAAAIRHDLTLATGNVRHFERVRQLGYPLKLEDWRQSISAPENGNP